MVVRAVFVLAVFSLLAACAGVDRTPVPVERHSDARISNIPNARYWGDVPPDHLDEIVAELRAQRQASGITHDSALALSGGADLGAYGAGVLTAWTAKGDRPEFTMVTGISTGALSAPFVFLGPEHDSDLKEIYGGYPPDQILRLRNPFEILPKASAVDTTPLQGLIAQYVDEEFLAKVAAEHRRGRRLLVQSTHMDAQRPVVWDMGAIAASGAPNALDLFRQVLLASASIPGVFSPALIEVEIDGEVHDEMHADGGVIAQLTLLSGWQTKLHALEDAESDTRLAEAYIIVNGKISPEPDAIAYKLPDIAGRALLTMIKRQLIDDLEETYQGLQLRGTDFYATWIGKDFTRKYEGPFNQDYMRALYDYGYRKTQNGDPWSRTPPDVESIG